MTKLFGEERMRNNLMAGTAVVAAAILAAGGAAAADKAIKPAISVGGYYEAVVGGILDEDMGADTSALDTRTDAEIHFNGRATLDSGMKIHARVELEGQNNHSAANAGGDPIDEYFLSLSGSFGQITLGGTGGAPVKMLTGLSGSWATGVGESLSFNDDWVGTESDGKGHGFYTMRHSRLDTGDAEKVTYISPKLGGFQVGATYSPNMQNNDSNARIVATAERHDGLEGAVSYGGKFGDVSFGVGAGMTAYQGGTGGTPGDSSDWLVAARLDFGGGFRVSIAHKQVTNDADAEQGSLTDIGARFVQGANQFSIVGMHGEMDSSDASHTKVIGSYARILGPGAKIHMNLLWNESSSPNGDSENGGVAAVVGVRVGF